MKFESNGSIHGAFESEGGLSENEFESNGGFSNNKFESGVATQYIAPAAPSGDNVIYDDLTPVFYDDLTNVVYEN